MDDQSASLPKNTVVSFYTFDACENALQHFSALYAPEYLALCPNESMVRKLKHPRERLCRFCGLRKPETSFNNKPHIIPEMLGNKYLISDYECDDCNYKFSVFENDLANFLGASRAIYGVQGKKMPTFKSVGNEIVVRKEEFYDVKNGTKITLNGDEGAFFNYNESTATLEVKYIKNAYTPVKVYKALLKMALSVIPEKHMLYYSELVQLLLHDPANELARFARVFVSRLPSQLSDYEYLVPRCHINQRISSEASVCMHSVSLYFLDYVIEFPLPLNAQDMASNLYAKKDFAIQLCPPLFVDKPSESLLSVHTMIEQSLAGTEAMKEEETYSIQHAADALKNTQIYNPATGEMKPSDGILPKIVAIYISRNDELPNFPIGPFNSEPSAG